MFGAQSTSERNPMSKCPSVGDDAVPIVVFAVRHEFDFGQSSGTTEGVNQAPLAFAHHVNTGLL
jgi:hypothetical protein